MNIINGIDLPKFKKWIIKWIGKKCPELSWDCIVCRTWRVYEDLKAFQDFIEFLDEEKIDKKVIRPHRK